MIDSTTETRYYREDALDRLDIGKTTFYKWIEYLEIEQSADEQRRKYLNQEQLKQLLELKKYHQQTGTIEGFLGEEKGGEIEVVKNQIISRDKENIYVEPEEPMANLDMDRLIREAAELKARSLAMTDLVKLGLAQQMSFEDLPVDLKEKVNAASEAANPKDSPASIASQLLARYRSGKNLPA
jgi:hypothetical protein